MNTKLNNIFKMLTGGATILAYGSYIDSIKNQQNTIAHKNEVHKHISILQNQISELEKQIPLNGESKNQIIIKINELISKLNNLKTIQNNYFSHFEKGNINPESSLNIYSNYKDQITSTFNKANGKINEITDALNNIKDKFMDDNSIIRIVNEYKEYLISLNTMEICLVINISTSLFILACIISILLSIFGNYLIDKLSLEKRFPRLSKIINLRVTFQKYYIFINSIFIIIAVLSLILINIITLMNK